MSRARAAEPERPVDADALEGVRSPRETATAPAEGGEGADGSRPPFGQDSALAAFEAALAVGRPHHAWLLRGPRGVGKATLAYRLALRLLGAERSAERLVAAGAHPGLFELRRGWNEATKKPRAGIAVDDVRRLIGFFRLSAADGGWRVGLIDAGDDLAGPSANALLKLVEEPPARAILFIVAHAPGRLPATLLSRCRRLDCAGLGLDTCVRAMRAAAPTLETEPAARLAALADGAPGEALRLWAAGGLEAYAEIVTLFTDVAASGRIEARRLERFAREVGKRGAGGPFETFARLAPLALERMTKACLPGHAPAPAGPREASLFARLERRGAAGARGFAAASVGVRARLDTALALNLDPGRTILDIAGYLGECRLA